MIKASAVREVGHDVKGRVLVGQLSVCFALSSGETSICGPINLIYFPGNDTVMNATSSECLIFHSTEAPKAVTSIGLFPISFALPISLSDRYEFYSVLTVL